MKTTNHNPGRFAGGKLSRAFLIRVALGLGVVLACVRPLLEIGRAHV